MSRSRKPRTFQSLENRELMAGDVAVAMDGFTLEIEEAAGSEGRDQSVQVKQIGIGEFRVEGLDGTLVNGQPFQDFSGVSAIDARLGSGDDRLDLLGNRDEFSGIAFTDIDLGAPDHPSASDNDTLTIKNFGTSRADIATGSEADSVTVTDFTWTDLVLDTGSGSDDLAFLDAGGGGLTDIDTGTGHDDLRFKEGSYTTLFVNTGSGNDDVWVEGLFASQLSLRTESGSDDVDVRNSRSHWYAFIDTGSSNERDTVDVRGLTTTFGDLTIKTGGGNDYVNLQNSTIADDVHLNTGSGDDYARIEHVTVRDDLFARLGSGDDRLLIDDSSFDWVFANGESDSDDRLYLTGRNRMRVFVPSSFERIS